MNRMPACAPSGATCLMISARLAAVVILGLVARPPACGVAEAQVAPGAPATAPAQVSGTYRSDRLGIEYRLVPHRGHYGAKLTRPPFAGSPFLTLRRPAGDATYLEPGDMIVTLDKQVIDGPDDLEAHILATAVEIVNIRTGAADRMTAMFPAAVDPPVDGRNFTPTPPPIPPPPAPVRTTAGESRRVKAVLVLDTESKLPGLNLNLDRMRSFLRLVDPKRVDVAVIDGDQATTGNILATIQGLGDCSNDTVLFYYSGHCATDLGRGHTLTFSHGPDRYLLRATLTREIARLRPRLAVVLTDGCSNLGVLPPPDAPTKAAPAPSATPPAEETLPQRIARSLLLRTRGFVDINGSTFDAALGLNEAGIYGDEGGFFTSALFFGVAGPFVNTYEDIDRNHDGVVAWAEVLPSIRKALRIKYGTTRHVALSTPDKLSERIRKTLNGQLTQTPHAFSLDGPALEPRVEEAFFLGASLTDATAVDPETKRPIAGARLGDVVDPIDQLGSVMTILGGAVAEGDLVIAVNNKPIRSIRDLKSAGASSSAVNDVRIWSPKRQAFETVHLTPEQTGSSLPPVTPQPGPAPPPGGGESHAPRPARPY